MAVNGRRTIWIHQLMYPYISQRFIHLKFLHAVVRLTILSYIFTYRKTLIGRISVRHNHVYELDLWQALPFPKMSSRMPFLILNITFITLSTLQNIFVIKSNITCNCIKYSLYICYTISIPCRVGICVIPLYIGVPPECHPYHSSLVCMPSILSYHQYHRCLHILRQHNHTYVIIQLCIFLISDTSCIYVI